MNWKLAQDSFEIDAKKYEIDPDTKFLHLPIIIARVGVLDYPEDDEKRYFPPEVLKAAANSADYGVMTLLHPDTNVDVFNVKLVNKGVMKAGTTFDGEFLRGNAIIQDQEFIDDILSKRIIEVSAGYRYKDDACEGVFKAKDGTEKKYDTALTFIKYNHFAGVPAGRAGENVKFITDKKGKKMSDIEKELNALKIGADELLPGVTIIYTKDSKSAVDTMTTREKTLMDKIQSQDAEIQTLKASNAANKESLDALKTAQDGMIKKDDLNALTAELLDSRQIAEKIGLDCKDETDALSIKSQALEKMLPQSYKNLKDSNNLQNKQAIDAAYNAMRENLGFHKEVFDTKQALVGQQGMPAPGFNRTPSPRLTTLEHFSRG